MYKLETEIINILGNSRRPMELDIILDRSKLTKYSQRLNAVLLDLIDKKIVFLVNQTSLSRFSNMFGLIKEHGSRYPAISSGVKVKKFRITQAQYRLLNQLDADSYFSDDELTMHERNSLIILTNYKLITSSLDEDNNKIWHLPVNKD